MATPEAPGHLVGAKLMWFASSEASKLVRLPRRGPPVVETPQQLTRLKLAEGTIKTISARPYEYADFLLY